MHANSRVQGCSSAIEADQSGNMSGNRLLRTLSTPGEVDMLAEDVVIGVEGLAHLGALRARLQELHGFVPRDEQVKAIDTLINARQDLILIAKTGWGKSLIFQSVPCLIKNSICLMIIPLNLLEEDQAQCMRELKGCKPCVLNGETNSAALRSDIQSGLYTHVLTSPDIALGDAFQPVLQHPSFQSRLALIAIDEMHVVADWGTQWRGVYSRLRELRARVRLSIPWFGTTATLDPGMLEVVKDLTSFTDPIVTRTSVDRPEIFFNFQIIQPRVRKMSDHLRFLVMNGYPEQVLPKTIVYVERISDGYRAITCLRSWLCKLGASVDQARDIVVAYNSEVAELFDKSAVANEFLKPGSVH